MKVKFRLILFFALLHGLLLHAQDTYVPIKVKNQFGVANMEGKIMISPQFEMLQPIYGYTNTFMGIRTVDGKLTTSLLHNNKILIKDKLYMSYSLDSNFIFARKNKYYITDPKELKDWGLAGYTILYQPNGTPVFSNDVELESFLDAYHYRNRRKFKEHLLLIKNKNVHQIVSIDISNYKIASILLDNIEVSKFEVVDNAEPYIVINYIDKSNNKRICEIDLSKDKIIKRRDSLEVAKVKDVFENYDGYGVGDYGIDAIDRAPGDNDYYNNNPEINSNIVASKILFYSDVIKRGINYSLKLVPSSYTSILNTNKIIKSDGKYGLINTKSNSMLLPAIYDSIIPFESFHFILHKDGKYGLYRAFEEHYYLIVPKFENMVVPSKVQYDKMYGYTLSIFDPSYNFLYYANENGKLYYQE